MESMTFLIEHGTRSKLQRLSLQEVSLGITSVFRECTEVRAVAMPQSSPPRNDQAQYRPCAQQPNLTSDDIPLQNVMICIYVGLRNIPARANQIIPRRTSNSYYIAWTLAHDTS